MENHKYNNTVIECTSVEQGARIIKFWRDQKVDTSQFKGDVLGNYYGLKHNQFYIFRKRYLPAYITVLDHIPNDYPKLMLVSHDRNFNGINTFKRVVFMEKNGKYLAWTGADSFEEAEKVTEASTWYYAKDIEEQEEQEEQPQEFTFKEISEGKATGVPPHLIRIKE